MKQAAIALFLSWLLLVGCTVERPLPTVASVAQAPTATYTPLPMAADTPIPTGPVTATWVPTDTPTPIPATSSPTRRPTSTPVTLDPSLPLPTGRVYFLWDPNPIPEEIGLYEPFNNNFYEVAPETAPNDWHIEPVLEMLGYPVMIPAPDSTKLAILRYHDTNGDGVVDTYRGSDPPNIFSYSVVDNSLTQLTDNQWNPGTVSWLPNSQILSYPQLNDVLLIDLADPIYPEDLYTFDGYVHELAWSSDGKNLAVIHSSGGNPPDSTKLDIIQPENDLLLTITTNVDSGLGIIWSPGSQWLALTDTFLSRGLSVANASTHEIIDLVPSDELVFFEWSPSGQWLAFTHGATLFIWDANFLEIKPLVSMDALSPPSWSPDGDNIAAGFIEGEQSGLLFIDPANGSQTKLDLGIFADQPIWSPDGEWLLFSSGMDDRVGLYMVHKDGSIPFLFLETTGRQFPYAVYWLPK